MESSVKENSADAVRPGGDAAAQPTSPLVGFLVFLVLFGLTVLIAMGLITLISVVLSQIF